MGKTVDRIDDRIAGWIRGQKLFFVATAPLAGDGHVNCSPKGGDTFRVIDPTTVVYQDLTGSGAETIAHLRENGRIVIMFCAFEGPPNILRLHGRGEALPPGHPDYETLAAGFPGNPGARAIIRVRVARVSESCGYAVPLLDFRNERNTLDQWVEAKGPDALIQYRREKNAQSIDGLPALEAGIKKGERS